MPDDEVGVTAVGVAAVELASDDGTVGAAATADVVESEVLVGVVVDELGVEPIVEVEPVVPDAADAALAAVSVAEVTISPLAVVSARNDDALGW